MAARESIHGALSRSIVPPGEIIEPELHLAELRHQLHDDEQPIHYRPVTRTLRVTDSGRRIVYQGWRAESIAATLDACAFAQGDLWIRKVQMIGAAGQVYTGHKSKSGAHLQWRQQNLDAAKANSRLQAEKFRAKARIEWHAYTLAYRLLFTTSEPIGFDRWCRTARASWLAHGAQAITENVAVGMAAVVAADHSEVRGRHEQKKSRGMGPL